MKGMPHYRQYPMGDVVNANLEPGEYVVRRNAVNALGTENMEMLNHADGAHGALNKLMVSASLVHLQPQDNSPVKIEANGFPIADSPVRQRVDATRNMQEGGSVDLKRKTDETWSEAYSKYDILGEDDNYQRIYKSSLLGKVPAEIVGGEGGDRYYLGEGTSKAKSLAWRKARAMMDQKISHSPSDSIPAAMVGDYFPEYMQEEAPMEEAPVEAPKKKGRLRGLLGFQEGGEVDFKQHMMYDKSDEGHLAKTYEDHLQMKKMGYSHKGMQEGGEVEDDPVMFPAGKNIFGQPTEDMSQSQMSDMLLDMMTSGGVGGTLKLLGKGAKKLSGKSLKKKLIGAVDEAGLPDAYGEPMSYFKDMHTDDLAGILKDYYGKELYQANRGLHSALKKGGYQEGGEVGKYEKALQKAEMMGDAGYALPESLSAPAEEMSNMRPAEDLYGMYMRMGPEMIKDKMSGMESRSLDALLQQKMNNMGKSAVPHYQDGGEVEEDINPKQLQAMAMLDSLGQGGGERLDSPPPSDSYNGMPAEKDLDVLMPYLNSFGRMQTPLQEWNMRTLHRHGLNPENFTPQMRGLIGRAVIQQLGAEGS